MKIKKREEDGTKGTGVIQKNLQRGDSNKLKDVSEKERRALQARSGGSGEELESNWGLICSQAKGF